MEPKELRTAVVVEILSPFKCLYCLSIVLSSKITDSLVTDNTIYKIQNGGDTLR